ncbi:MAG: ankyrin repeat domain-containing protein [Defluviicoccus sp.]|nr:ankyrin repeat domain-containing protein [Defluviicoccus sp.]MDE0383261.1 ankyrin repeat domain-containing protein [Defluviicoccus sp.]
MKTGSLCRVAALIAVALPIAATPAAQSAEPRDTPEAEAKAWAEKLLKSFARSPRRDEVGRVMAMQPLLSRHFEALNRRQRHQLHRWLRHAFDETAFGMLTLIDIESLRDISDMIEGSGASRDAWWERYRKVLERAQVRVNIVCKGVPGEDRISLDCSAVDMTDSARIGGAAASFRLEWLNRPVALEFGVRSIAAEIVAGMEKPGGTGEIRIAGGGHVGTSRLSKHVAELLEDAIAERARARIGWAPFATDERNDAARHRLEMRLERLTDRLVLRVAHYENGLRRSPIRERIALSSLPGGLSGGGDPADVVLPEGYTLADWTMLAENRLKKGEPRRVLIEANAHVRKHGPIPALIEVRDRAASRLLESIPLDDEGDAAAALARIEDIEALAGEGLASLRLKARAHRVLGDYRAESEVRSRWLAAADDRPERREMVHKLAEALAFRDAADAFAERMGRPFSGSARDATTGWTDMHTAAALNLPRAVAALVERGMEADVRLGNTGFLGSNFARGLAMAFADWKADGETPLMVAAAADARDAADRLIRNGADISAKDTNGATALHHALAHRSLRTAALLLHGGADIDAADRLGDTPLHRAARRDNRATAQFLLERGARVDATDASGSTPLHHAAWNGAVETARLLLEGGAHTGARDDRGDTPLHLAAARDARRTAGLLQERGAEIEARNAHGMTPLQRAAWANARGTAALLLDRGADVNARDAHGVTPLHRAAWRDFRAMAELLLDRGAKVDAGNEYGAAPSHYAAWNGARQTLDMLRRRGADAGAKDRAGLAIEDYSARNSAGAKR